VRQHKQSGRLAFVTSFKEAPPALDFIFLCVGARNTPDNKVDLSAILNASIEIKSNLSEKLPIVVTKSTVPPGTTNLLEYSFARHTNGHGAPAVVSNPEFLREGRAVFDFLHPSRVIIGSRNGEAAAAVAELYKPLNSTIFVTDTRTAEMIKYASNAFLACKISFVNEIATLCEKLGMDIKDVTHGMGLDPRIGRDHMAAGIGYGGSCLPKDLAVLTEMARSNGLTPQLLGATHTINSLMPQRFVQSIKQRLGTLKGAKVAVLGVTFKAHTDDTRESPALAVIDLLRSEGARVTVYDPKFKQTKDIPADVSIARDIYEAAKDCDAAAITTAWPDFKTLDLPRLRDVMKGNVLADGRNLLDMGRVSEAGFVYVGVGRGGASPDLLEQYQGNVRVHAA
jgi:UDPglucose 6-dehydrogenase